MAETNESENTLNPNTPGQNDASKTTVPPVRDPMSLRDTDTGNLKRLTPGQAKKTIKLKPLTAKSTTTLPAVGATDQDDEDDAPQEEASATSNGQPMIKLKPIATVASPSPLTAKSSAATIRITPKMKTGEAGAAEASPTSQTIKLNTINPATGEAKSPASGSAVLRPAGSATAGGLKPVVPGAISSGVKLTAVKPAAATSGIKPLSSGSAVLRPAGSATSGGLKPVMPGATASGLKPVMPGATATGLKPVMPGATASGLKPVLKTATASGLKPLTAPGAASATSGGLKPGLSLAKPKPIEATPEEAPESKPEATAVIPAIEAPAAKKLSISKPVAPASEPETEIPFEEPSKPGLSIPKKEAGVQPNSGSTSGLKIKHNEENIEEKEHFEKELKSIQGDTGAQSSETASATAEPGILLALCNIAAVIMVIGSVTLCTVQYLNQWKGKDIKLPGLENIADTQILGKKATVAATGAVKAPAAEQPAATPAATKKTAKKTEKAEKK